MSVSSEAMFKKTLTQPTWRKLRVFAFDPSLSTELENYEVSEVLVDVRWDEKLKPGPVGEYLEVIDVDPASNCAYAPIDLNDYILLAGNGLAPSEGNPHFHQQMVYTVTMATVQSFERALGREVLWSDHRIESTSFKGAKGHGFPPAFLPTDRLRIYPHALRENNAYYDSSKKALLFGYFPAHPMEADVAMPGGLVFTCLSYDIIAHEATHAILDGVQPRFMEPTNADVLAFHEAFADIVALLQHFSYPEILRRQIAKARGRLSDTHTLLGELAVQFGKATGGRGALRSAIGFFDKDGKWRRNDPDPNKIQTEMEPHARGALLVAAVFRAFLAIYDHRTRDLFRIASGGTGVLPDGDLHPDLVNRLADEAAKSAGHLLNMCIRAIDYCPPVDITFGDYLRALITADFDMAPDDERKYRVAVVEAFRQWGIYPEDVRTLSVDSLRWNFPDMDVNKAEYQAFVHGLKRALEKSDAWAELKTGVRSVRRNFGEVVIEKLNRRDVWQRSRELRGHLHQRLNYKVEKIVERDLNNRSTVFGLNAYFGHEDDKKFSVETVRVIRRAGPNGRDKEDLLIQITQRRPGFLDEAEQQKEDERFLTPNAKRPPDFSKCDFKFRSGTSFIVDLETYEVRYAISKSILSERRLQRQRDFHQSLLGTSERSLYFGAAAQGQALANLHADHDY